MPLWNEMVERYRDSEKLKIACVNCEQEEDMCYDVNVFT